MAKSANQKLKLLRLYDILMRQSDEDHPIPVPELIHELERWDIKAERWFKERRIKYQEIDLKKYGVSRGELTSVKNAVGLTALIDESHPDFTLLEYLAYDQDKLEKLLEDPSLLRTPIVRNGKQATVGYHPEIWETWT